MEYKFKGTGGSWRVFDANGYDFYPGIESTNPDRAIVCFGAEIDDEAGVRGDIMEEREANAHLIAASPKLLNACIDMIDKLRGDQRADDELKKGLGIPVYNSMLNMIEAVELSLNLTSKP